ncbi:MAG: DUF4339 domain-containing protein [Verrucomicrobiae bacterium]|nr:DUF4339 domain-containing protein [Verrucomicrobiae bacterium]
MTYYYVDTNNAVQGPVDLAALQDLKYRGQINAGTPVTPVGDEQWKTLGDILAATSGPLVGEPLLPPPPGPGVPAEIEGSITSGSSWFYWIAALSLINSLILFFGGNTHFVIGLGIMQIIDGLGIGMAEGGLPSARYVCLFLDVVIAGGFVCFGIFGRSHFWVYLTGVMFYVLDALIYLVVGEWMSFGFHVFALIFLIKGLASLREKNRILAAGPVQTSAST